MLNIGNILIQNLPKTKQKIAFFIVECRIETRKRCLNEIGLKIKYDQL